MNPYTPTGTRLVLSPDEPRIRHLSMAHEWDVAITMGDWADSAHMGRLVRKLYRTFRQAKLSRTMARRAVIGAMCAMGYTASPAALVVAQ